MKNSMVHTNLKLAQLHRIFATDLILFIRSAYWPDYKDPLWYMCNWTIDIMCSFRI